MRELVSKNAIAVRLPTPAGEKVRLQQCYGAVPDWKKIIVNMRVSEDIDNQKAMDAAVKDLAQITGQRPVDYHRQ